MARAALWLALSGHRNGRFSQVVDPMQNRCGQGARHGHLGQLEDDVAAVAHIRAPILTSFSRKVVSDHCATASGSASGWDEEVETAFEREQEARDTVLFPIRLDATIMEQTAGQAADIKRTHHIGDFTRAMASSVPAPDRLAARRCGVP
jgi:hypothetical protein